MGGPGRFGAEALLIRAAYLAPEGFEAPLASELARRGVSVEWHGRLAVSDRPPVTCAWAQDIWTAPHEAPAPSIKAAADTLRAVQRNWATVDAAGQHRRMTLIADRLPPVRARPLRFPDPAPAAHLGAWTLLAPDRLLFSPVTASPFPRGECRFAEDRAGPPSRAYLKAWEAWTLWGAHPAPGERCIDLGAAPGGWTWAAAVLGARVLAVDKAPLDDAVAALPGVETRIDSAFALDPAEWAAEPFDWLLCDIIAYPARSLALVQRWIVARAARRVVCTLKFQGDTDHDAADAFAAVPGGRLRHLFHNKHELTFTWPHEESSP